MTNATTADTAPIMQRMKTLGDEKRIRILEQLAGWKHR
jgi:DNA-binding transcriptional ArsR family regulator